MAIPSVHLDVHGDIVGIEPPGLEIRPVGNPHPVLHEGLQNLVVSFQCRPDPELEISQALRLLVVIPVLAGLATELPVNSSSVESGPALQADPVLVIPFQ